MSIEADFEVLRRYRERPRRERPELIQGGAISMAGYILTAGAQDQYFALQNIMITGPQRSAGVPVFTRLGPTRIVINLGPDATVPGKYTIADKPNDRWVTQERNNGNLPCATPQTVSFGFGTSCCYPRVTFTITDPISGVTQSCTTPSGFPFCNITVDPRILPGTTFNWTATPTAPWSLVLTGSATLPTDCSLGVTVNVSTPWHLSDVYPTLTLIDPLGNPVTLTHTGGDVYVGSKTYPHACTPSPVTITVIYTFNAVGGVACTLRLDVSGTCGPSADGTYLVNGSGCYGTTASTCNPLLKSWQVPADTSHCLFELTALNLNIYSKPLNTAVNFTVMS
jgi:hypothetical protein